MLHLRILATSDLHAFLHDFDYARDRPDPTVGLARTATLIAAARAEVPNHLLFDNGDLLQGSLLGDYTAAHPGAAAHPAIRALGTLRYDAATLGNHEFNYGLPFLERALAAARFPYVCANLTRPDGQPFLPPTTLLTRTFHDAAGAAHPLRIGVIGFVPPQIMSWDRANLEGHLAAEDIVDAATRHLPALRARSDLVVALCHAGISAAPRTPCMENAALALARDVPGLDVIVTGHTHRVFPGPDHGDLPGVDAVKGTLAGVPAVMPGFWGSHLGVVDLTLTRTNGTWSVAASTVEARPIHRRDPGGTVLPLTTPAQPILDETRPEHEATVAWAARPVGTLQRPLDTFFALVADNPAVRLVNAAQLWHARTLFTAVGRPVPLLLSAAAPAKAGGTNYLDLPAGPLALRHLADLCPFPNTFVVVEVTGATLAEWLERSAALFARIDPADPAPQDLLAPGLPAFNFDTIAGLTYRIDLTQPARYTPGGHLANPTARRIRDLHHDGRPLDPGATFAVATNNYRADSPTFPGLGPGATVLFRGPHTTRDALVRWIEAEGDVGHHLPPPSWSFHPAPRPLRLAFSTAPAARTRLPGHLALEDTGNTAAGLARFVLTIPLA